MKAYKVIAFGALLLALLVAYVVAGNTPPKRPEATQGIKLQ
jgi:hypothetical protein